MSRIAASQILCDQCSAPLTVEQGARLVICEFCGSTNHLDKSRVILHYAVEPTMTQEAAESAMRRWMAGNDTVKGLDQDAEVVERMYQLFPMWMVRGRVGNNERIYLEPAAAVSVSELKDIQIPAASLQPYDHSLDDQAVLPTVPYDTMLHWLEDDHNVNSSAVLESSLVHLPFFIFKYRYEGEQYTTYVDAATGRVLASIFPIKFEAPYLGIAILAFAIYFFIAFIPLFFLFGGNFGFGLLVYLIAVVVAAIPLFGIAAYVSAKA